MVGFIVAFWAAPKMSVGHLLFAFTTTAYILVAIVREERDLTGFYDERSASTATVRGLSCLFLASDRVRRFQRVHVPNR